MGKKLKDFLIGLAVGIVISALIVFLNPSGAERWTHRVCDGAFVSCALLLAWWGLIAARNQGTFDVAGYGLKSVAQRVLPSIFGEKEDANAAEYAQRKAEKRRSATGFAFAGLVFGAVTAVTLILYTNGI